MLGLYEPEPKATVLLYQAWFHNMVLLTQVIFKLHSQHKRILATILTTFMLELYEPEPKELYSLIPSTVS